MSWSIALIAYMALGFVFFWFTLPEMIGEWLGRTFVFLVWPVWAGAVIARKLMRRG